ncbi:phage regulatory CII family protein [Thalassospira alkalitolerans]|uniref:phage regulatory CII family protein n=1 Tax=Thalassospira alkalitolerans TaxID=1293890 RepID=UPI0030ECBB7E|tara:strand:+ start:2833 stop:3306 length:474 start_codon:yes stop_codon:yes gene_type:complete
MARIQSDRKTLDLLSWQPTSPRVERFEEQTVRAATISGKVSLAVSRILGDAKSRDKEPLEREDVARRMSDFLGEDVSKNMIDAYASQSREDHKISVVRAVALMHATQDYRLLTLLAEELGLTVIPRKYEGTVREAILAEKIEELNGELHSLRRGRKS